MKKLILVALIANSICSYAQKELYGTWTVSCPIEFIDEASSKHCAICPMVKENQSSVSIKDFEMTVDKDELTFNINGTTTKVKYIWRPDIHTIVFTLAEQKYKFKTLYNCGEHSYILKDEEGLLITLDEKKK